MENLIQITANQLFVVGSFRRKALTTNGCNEPYKDRFWCPCKHWFMTDPCPFINKNECMNYYDQCGQH